ncbi:GNAT family N-acetyltransferase [Amycolatopsis speibonae]|uniref:GNAT family N-acetyltransferase n=1 Tax=Amycolatopsis speibonae TaxID=1450224 RepID=A0ABV7P0S4_9PSEU
MNESEVRSETAKAAKTSMSRELIELAALFIAAGVAHLFVSMLSLNSVGPVVLFALGLLLIATAALRRWWTHRPRAKVTRVVADELPPPPGGAWRIRATVRDVPGSLAAVTAALAAHRYDIVSMQVLAVPDGVVDEFLLRAPAGVTAADIAAVTQLGGGKEVRVVPADVHEFVDLPTRVLTIAAQAAGPPADSAQLLRAVLGDCVITPQQTKGRPRAQGSGECVEGTSMRLVAPDGGLMMVTRPPLPFTLVEFARAKAVLDLKRCLAGAPITTTTLRLAAGTEVAIRPVTPGDAAAIEEMHERCSAESRGRRYGRERPPAFERLLEHKGTRTLLAETLADGVIAVATLRKRGRCAEVGILVEDQWQGRRIGTALLCRLITLARIDGCVALVAIAQEANTAMIRAMWRAGAQTDHVEPDLTHLTVYLNARSGVPGPRPGDIGLQ